MNESSPIRTDRARAFQPEPPASPTRRRFRPLRWMVLVLALLGLGAVGQRWYEADRKSVV